MDDHEMVHHAVAVRVEGGEVDNRIGRPDGLGHEVVDRSVRGVDSREAVLAVIRHRMATHEPHRDDGRVDCEGAVRGLRVKRAHRWRARRGVAEESVEEGLIVRRFVDHVREFDQEDEDVGRAHGGCPRADQGRALDSACGPRSDVRIGGHEVRPADG